MVSTSKPGKSEEFFFSFFVLQSLPWWSGEEIAFLGMMTCYCDESCASPASDGGQEVRRGAANAPGRPQSALHVHSSQVGYNDFQEYVVWLTAVKSVKSKVGS